MPTDQQPGHFVKSITAAGLILAVFVGLALLFMPAKVRLGGQTIAVDVADDEAERKAGLGGRQSLDEGTGMLFIFDSNDRQGIWMKDMEFPIDVIWLSADKKIVHIESDMQPDSYPAVFRPDENARYVIEVPAGFAAKHHIHEGQQAEFDD